MSSTAAKMALPVNLSRISTSCKSALLSGCQSSERDSGDDLKNKHSSSESENWVIGSKLM